MNAVKMHGGLNFASWKHSGLPPRSRQDQVPSVKEYPPVFAFWPVIRTESKSIWHSSLTSWIQSLGTREGEKNWLTKLSSDSPHPEAHMNTTHHNIIKTFFFGVTRIRVFFSCLEDPRGIRLHTLGSPWPSMADADSLMPKRYKIKQNVGQIVSGESGIT